MPPRITLHSSASGSSTSKTRPSPDQRIQAILPNGKSADMSTGENDELSDTDEPSPEEVDELDESDGTEKDAQPQWETISASPDVVPSVKPPVKRQRPKPPTTRTPGQTIVPMSRIEAILSTDVGQNGISSKEASFLVSLATEEFIRRLTRAAHSRSRLDGRSLTTYNDIADTAYYFEEYKFLQEMIPRPMSVKVALAERKRIREEQEALLHGVGVNGADSAGANQYKIDENVTSSSTSKASTPVPRLTKRNTPNTSANGKTSSRSKNPPTGTRPHVIRSERQKSKKARLAAESQAAAEATAKGDVAPPPSPSVKEHDPEDGVFINGAAPTSKSGGMKIKIRPRVASTTPASSPMNSTPQPTILPLGPPAKSPSSRSHERDVPLGHPRSQHNSGENTDDCLVFEEDAKSGAANVSINGKPGNVQFAPVGVDASEQPLWTRVPLPPPPSVKVGKAPPSPKDTNNNRMVTDLDDAVEQTRVSRASKSRPLREHEGTPPSNYSQDGPRPVEHTNGIEPPAKRPRQRQRSGESAPSKGSLREVLNGAFPNTGRTIYSQR